MSLCGPRHGFTGAVAEHEREMIPKRTKDALGAARRRGVKLGNSNLQAGDAVASAAARDAYSRHAEARAAEVLPFIEAARKAGALTLREIAAAMEARGIRTPSGRGRWHAATVLAVQRLAERAQPAQQLAA